MKFKFYIVLIILIFISCNNSTNNKKEIEKLDIDYREDIKNRIEKNFSILNTQNYFSDKILIGKIGKLNGFNSINIKGYRFYKLNKNGQIVSTYDISNNYDEFSYDKLNRLISVKYKQHNPPETYAEFEYKYSKENTLFEIKKISFENNKKINTEIVSDKIKFDKMKKYFVRKKETEYLINNDERKIITYENRMIFCCGEIMNGKNKLTYYLNKNGLIDSLIINGIETKREMKFVYEYE
jgi:hypothetical protein